MHGDDQSMTRGFARYALAELVKVNRHEEEISRVVFLACAVAAQRHSSTTSSPLSVTSFSSRRTHHSVRVANVMWWRSAARARAEGPRAPPPS